MFEIKGININVHLLFIDGRMINILGPGTILKRKMSIIIVQKSLFSGAFTPPLMIVRTHNILSHTCVFSVVG